MHKSFNALEIGRFRSQAKKQARAGATGHLQALNAIALEHGYTDWSLLMKHADPNALAAPFMFLRTDGQMALAMRLVQPPGPRHGRYQTRGEYARSKVEDIQARFVSAANAVDFAVAYMESALRVPRYSAPLASVANHEMHLWLPYSALGMGTDDSGPQILVNRQYKPVGDVSGQHVTYEDHTHLHLNASQADRAIFSHRPGATGFLYNDGCTPWRSRTNGEGYLARLQSLRSVLMKSRA